MDRSQTDTTGIALLTMVVAFTVAGTGTVVMGEWQSGIDQGPVVDIATESTPVNITLEHRGGNTLYPQNTTVYLVGADKKIELEEPFQPGSSISREFDRLNGTFELRVVHDPLETVVYRETHRINNPVEGILLAIGEWTQPAYVIEGYPANYTVNREFKFGFSENIAERVNVTVDDESLASVDEEDTTITGLSSGSVNAKVEAGDYTNETEVTILQDPPVLELKTHNLTTTGPTSVKAKGELSNLGRLPEVDLLFEIVPHRAFNELADDNGDNISASGEWRTDPEGYTHDSYSVHDNRPLVPGETRTYYYDNPGSGADYLWYLRDGEDSGTYPRNDYYRGGAYWHDWPGGDSRIEVTLSEDGETVDVILYNDATGDSISYSDTDVSTNGGNVYFTTLEDDGSTGSNSLRLTDIYEPSNSETVNVQNSAQIETSYSADISGLDPDRTYTARALAEQEIGGKTVTAFGDPLTTNTESQTVDTVDTDPVGGTVLNATGQLVDIGSLDTTDLLFEYVPHRAFNEDGDDNGDNILAGRGEWRTDPRGYTHDSYSVHDNRPLVPGETRTYYYDNPGSGADYLWYLRDGEDSGTYPRNDYYRGGWVYHDWPGGDSRIEVTLSEDGETVDVILYNDATGESVSYADTDVSTNDGDVYFTTLADDGSTGSNSLRFTDIHEPSRSDTVEVETGVTENTTYSTNITGLTPDRNYSVRAYAEEVVNGITVNDTGEEHTSYITGPTVQTVGANVTGGTSIEAEGELVEIGDLQQTDLLFEYVPHRAFNEDGDDNGDNILAGRGEWRTDPEGYTHDSYSVHDNRPLVPGETRTYYYTNPGSGADYLWYLRDGEDSGTYPRNDYYRGGAYWHDWPGGDSRIEVTLSEDGETVDVILYNDATGDSVSYADTDVSTNGGDVYFTTLADDGSTGSDSLRLTDIYEPSRNETVEVETNVTENTTYSTELDSLDPDRTYSIRAFAERIVDNVTITESGDEVAAATESATVETLSAQPNGNRIEAEGELLDLGTLQQTDLWFETVPYRDFNQDSNDNGDNILAGRGEWRTDPEGYTHDSYSVHDNRPLVPGETRTYYYTNPGSGADYLYYLRDGEDSGSYPRNDYHRGGSFYHDWPGGDSRIEVTLSEDGETVDIILYNDVTGDSVSYADTGVSTNGGDVYFSTLADDGSSGSDSLRLTGIHEPSNSETVEVETGVTENTTYSTDIVAEFERTYAVRAFAEREVDNTTIVNTGDTIEVETGSPGGP